MALRDRVKEAVDAYKAKGKSVRDLAGAIGVKPSAIYQWLDGSTKNIKNEPLGALSNETGFSTEYIATGKGSKHKVAVFAPSEGPDLSSLTMTVKAVEEYLDREELTLDPPAKAKLIALLYEICVAKGKIEAPAVARYLRLVA